MAATGLGNTFSSRALAGKPNGKLVKGLLGARLDRPLRKPAAEVQHPGPGEWHLSPSWGGSSLPTPHSALTPTCRPLGVGVSHSPPTRLQ